MARDAIEPGPGNTYPDFPRRADGTPAWSDTPEADGIPVVGPGGRLVTPMPRGMRHLRRKGERIAIDVTPRTPDGTPINPPVIVP